VIGIVDERMVDVVVKNCMYEWYCIHERHRENILYL